MGSIGRLRHTFPSAGSHEIYDVINIIYVAFVRKLVEIYFHI